MSCKACGELLDIYQHSVKDYATVVRKSRGLLGEELRLALKETIRLSEARKDANDALLAHFREITTTLNRSKTRALHRLKGDYGVRNLRPAGY